MPTKLSIFGLDKALIYKGLWQITNLKTEKKLIDFALQELIRTRKKHNLLDLSGQIKFSTDYDYKALREKRNVPD